MTGKRSTTLSGFLLSPLAVGRCALISHRGTLIRTSRVVAIHSMKHSEIRFETLNTHYRLLLDAFPCAAEQMSVCMAA